MVNLSEVVRNSEFLLFCLIAERLLTKQINKSACLILMDPFYNSPDSHFKW